MAYRFIDENKAEFGLRWLLNRIEICPNAYYNYQKHNKAEYEASKASVCNEIANIFHELKGIIGHRAMRVFLERKGIILSKTTVHKYMNKELHLYCICRRKKPGYRKGHAHKVFSNLLNQNFSSPIFKLCKCRKTSQPLCHYIIKNIAVKVKMHVEYNLDSDIFYDFWQLSGCAVVLCRNVGHISKITTNFSVSKRNWIWCTDFTYLFLTNGTVRYNCTIIDLHDRSVVASENGSWITSELAIRTLEKALRATGCRSEKLIIHSEQGSQFISVEFISYCEEKGITQSMSRAGCPYDNAPMERYYNTLKAELVYQFNFDTVAELDYAIAEFSYGWYNQIRPHSYDGYLTPFEKRFGVK